MAQQLPPTQPPSLGPVDNLQQANRQPASYAYSQSTQDGSGQVASPCIFDGIETANLVVASNSSATLIPFAPQLAQRQGGDSVHTFSNHSAYPTVEANQAVPVAYFPLRGPQVQNNLLPEKVQGKHASNRGRTLLSPSSIPESE